MILIVPTILGGLWQILELSSISTSYIRFFSVTQIVPDGLLVLFFLSSLYLSFKITMVIKNLKTEDDTSDTETEKPSSIWYILLLLSIFMAVIFYLIKTTYQPYDNQLYLSTLIILIPTFIILTSAFIYILREIFTYVHSKFPKVINGALRIKNNQILLKIFVIFIVLGGAKLLVVLMSLFSDFSKSYSFPESSVNIETLKKSLAIDYPNEESRILYMNDKYVFVELETKSGNKKNLVLEFNRLFFERHAIPQDFVKVESPIKIDNTISMDTVGSDKVKNDTIN